MKTKHFALALLALVLTINASATKIPEMKITPLDDSKALFSVVTDPDESSEISIFDEAGNVVYFKESEKSTGVSLVFNLSELENGIYTFKVKTGNASALREVEIHNGKVEVKELKAQLDPYFSLDGDLLKVLYLNYGSENMNLHIYKGNELIFELNLGNQFVVQKGFNISELKSGGFDIVLAGNNQVYNYRIAR